MVKSRAGTHNADPRSTLLPEEGNEVDATMMGLRTRIYDLYQSGMGFDLSPRVFLQVRSIARIDAFPRVHIGKARQATGPFDAHREQLDLEVASA